MMRFLKNAAGEILGIGGVVLYASYKDFWECCCPITTTYEYEPCAWYLTEKSYEYEPCAWYLTEKSYEYEPCSWDITP
jgi:hypothetical protein